MIFQTTGDAATMSNATFYCPGMGYECGSVDNQTYKGLLDEGSKIVWHMQCAKSGCNGILTMEKVDSVNPYLNLVRQIIINACSYNDTAALWYVVRDFVSCSADMMKIFNTKILNVRQEQYPFKFMGYLAKLWLPLLAPTRVNAGVVNDISVEHSERGILLIYHDIRIGLFESLSTTQLYSAAYYIEQELRRQSSRVTNNAEDCDAMNISISGVIEYLDRMVFDLGSPLDEIHTITRLLAIEYRDKERKDNAKEITLRKAAGILWLLRDACYEEYSIDKPKPQSKISMDY